MIMKQLFTPASTSAAGGGALESCTHTHINLIKSNRNLIVFNNFRGHLEQQTDSVRSLFQISRGKL